MTSPTAIVSKGRHCNWDYLHADSEDSDQTGRMPRLIGVFAGRTVILLVLSCCGSNIWIYPYTQEVARCKNFKSENSYKCFVCLFVLRLNVPVNNFSVMSGRSHRFLGH